MHRPAASLAFALLSTALTSTAAAQNLRVDLLAPDQVEPGQSFDVLVRADFTESGLTDDARLAVFTAFFITENAEIVSLQPAELFANASPGFDLDFDDVFGRPAVVLQADEIVATENGFEVGVPVPAAEADLFVLTAVAGTEGEASISFVTDELPDLDTPIGASGVFIFLTLPNFDITFADFDNRSLSPTPRTTAPSQISLIGTFSVSVPITIEPAPCPADITGDDTVDLADFNVLGINFGIGPGATLEQGDLNDDGFVNLADFNILGINFGNSCP